MKKQYHAIDIMKFFSAVMVVVVHSMPLMPFSREANFIIINIVGRFAVPFFFISSGFFVSMKSRENPTYFKKYMRALIKLYLFWSILYIPFGFQWVQQNMDIPYVLYPIALLLGIFYIGTYYHLWYMPALIFSLYVVHWCSKRIRHRSLLPLTFLLFCIGSLETYYGVVPFPEIQTLIDGYMTIMFTTRNGLFFGLFFVACGFYLSKPNRAIHIEHKKMLLGISIILLIIEAYILDTTNTLNFNFLIMLAPCTVLLFLVLRDIDIPWKLDYHKMRQYGEYYYFTHAFFLVLIPEFLNLFGKRDWYDNNGIFRLITIMICTHVLTMFIYRIKQNKKKKIRVMN